MACRKRPTPGAFVQSGVVAASAAPAGGSPMPQLEAHEMDLAPMAPEHGPCSLRSRHWPEIKTRADFPVARTAPRPFYIVEKESSTAP